MKEVAFIMGVEKNENIQLEKMAMLLVRSIRKYGGIYSNSPIYSLQPTGKDIDASTIAEFNNYGVVHRKKMINLKYSGGFGFYNMPFVCDYLANVVKEEYTVWLDIDVLCLNEPIFPDIKENEIVCDIYDKNKMCSKNISSVFKDLGKGSYLESCLKRCYADIEYPETGHYTWFQFKKTKNDFWRFWKNKFINIMEDMRNSGVDLLDNRLHTAEEIAYTLALLESKNFTTSVPEYLGSCEGITNPLSNKTQFFHYDGFKEWDNFYKIFEGDLISQDKRKWIIEACIDLNINLKGKHYLNTL